VSSRAAALIGATGVMVVLALASGAVRAEAPAVGPGGGGPGGGAANRHGSAIGGMDCSACHTTGGWEVSDAAAAGGGFDHAVTGFPLLGEHASTACSGCHDGDGAPTSACAGCHREPHVRRLGDSCADCHTASSWRDTATKARHRRSRMPLTGRHAVIECAACHRRQDPRTYASTPTACFACHASDYRRDLHPDHDGAAGAPGQASLPRECGRCHSTVAWSPAVADPSVLIAARRIPAGHDARFPISSGVHRAPPCESCHLSPARPRALTCVGCHTRGRLEGQHPRARLELDAASCLRCHPGGRRR
jgi:hypothetical protein